MLDTNELTVRRTSLWSWRWDGIELVNRYSEDPSFCWIAAQVSVLDRRTLRVAKLV